MTAKTDHDQAPEGVPGYEREPRRPRQKLVTEEYEYELPFNYENITVVRRHYKGSEFHGMELNPFNSFAGTAEYVPTAGDAIIVEEPHPIVRVVVIGSACTPPGYVQIECEPTEGWRRPDELATVMPVRMRINNLWGMHLRYDQWYARCQGEIRGVGGDETYEAMPPALLETYPFLAEGAVKAHAREWPLAGVSCAVFETPPSGKVTVSGGCEIPGWQSDNFPDDFHYSFRTIRTVIRLPSGCSGDVC